MADEIVHTKYEKAVLIGTRALQIAQGAPFKLELSEEELERIKYNPIEIAKLEYEKGVIPISVHRTLPSEKQEQDNSSKAQKLEAL